MNFISIFYFVIGIGLLKKVDSQVLPLTKEEYDAIEQDSKVVGYGETKFEKEEELFIPKNSFPENEMVTFNESINFMMGTDDPDDIAINGDGETPSRFITLSPFSIDKYEVSNGEFAEFVKATGFKTEVMIPT